LRDWWNYWTANSFSKTCNWVETNIGEIQFLLIHDSDISM